MPCPVLDAAITGARAALVTLESLDRAHGDELARRAVTEPPNAEPAQWVRWCLSLLALVPVLRGLLERAESPGVRSPELIAESLQRAASAPGLVETYLARLHGLTPKPAAPPSPRVVFEHVA